MALTATVYHVDLTRGTIETRTLPEDVYRKYPGGSALAAYLVLQAIPVGADPLGPDNVLAMAVSPLTGLAISGQSRMTACARSPLTGAIGDSQCGGFFPAEMRAAGADALVFTGRSPEPVYLWLQDGRAELRPAKHLWGKVTADVDRRDVVLDPGDPESAAQLVHRHVRAALDEAPELGRRAADRGEGRRRRRGGGHRRAVRRGWRGGLGWSAALRGPGVRRRRSARRRHSARRRRSARRARGRPLVPARIRPGGGTRRPGDAAVRSDGSLGRRMGAVRGRPGIGRRQGPACPLARIGGGQRRVRPRPDRVGRARRTARAVRPVAMVPPTHRRTPRRRAGAAIVTAARVRRGRIGSIRTSG